MSEWQPHEDTQAILDFAMTKLREILEQEQYEGIG
jgi:hypothetical protein